MQGLLENQSSHGRGAAATAARNRQVLVVMVCIILATYVALFVLPTVSGEELPVAPIRPQPPQGSTPKRPPPATRSEEVDSSPGTNDKEADTPDAPEANHHGLSKTTRRASIKELKPWGYNQDRNVPRWRGIYASIAADQEEHQDREFTLTDYGADQGFFSISVAAAFPTAVVIGVEKGGVGGEIWKKGKVAMDVLSIQEQKLRQNSLTNMMICQTTMKVDHFYALDAEKLRTDYQFVLSVFHWFDLRTRADFEKAISTLFRNAQTTFIELPTIGDDSSLIRKQVGYKNFKKWYDGRTDIAEIMTEAAKAHKMDIKVKLVVAVPWLKWTREVFRVDVIRAPGVKARPAVMTAIDSGVYGCPRRRDILECNTSRVAFNRCVV